MIGQLVGRTPAAADPDHQPRHQALLQSLQRGAKYFLTHPVALEDMLAALRRSLGEHAGRRPSRPGGVDPAPNGGRRQIIAVLGSRGGVGRTTLAVNLAATLAADPDNAVALIDLDLALGDADIALEVHGQRQHLASPTWPGTSSGWT